MNSIKKAWLSATATIAILLGVFFIGSAFMPKNTTSEPASLTGEKWFFLAEGQNPDLASSYSLANGDGESAADCNEGQEEICSIFAMPSANPDQPNLATVDKDKTILREVTQ